MKRLLLLLTCLLTALPITADESAFWQAVSWPAFDGVILHGLYHAPAQKGRLTWILLHGLGSVKEEWNPFAHALAKTGQGIFIYDARGHGESRRKADGQEVPYQNFASEEWQKMPQDIDSAVEMLEKKYGKSVNGFGVGGASLGANVALFYAAKNPSSKVKGLLLLSPGMEYAGLNIEKAFAQYAPRLLCMAASPEDRYAFQSVQILTSRRADRQLRVMEGPGAQHGVNMLNPTMTAKVIDWIRTVEALALLS